MDARSPLKELCNVPVLNDSVDTMKEKNMEDITDLSNKENPNQNTESIKPPQIEDSNFSRDRVIKPRYSLLKAFDPLTQESPTLKLSSDVLQDSSQPVENKQQIDSHLKVSDGNEASNLSDYELAGDVSDENEAYVDATFNADDSTTLADISSPPVRRCLIPETEKSLIHFDTPQKPFTKSKAVSEEIDESFKSGVDSVCDPFDILSYNCDPNRTLDGLVIQLKGLNVDTDESFLNQSDSEENFQSIPSDKSDHCETLQNCVITKGVTELKTTEKDQFAKQSSELLDLIQTSKEFVTPVTLESEEIVTGANSKTIEVIKNVDGLENVKSENNLVENLDITKEQFVLKTEETTDIIKPTSEATQEESALNLTETVEADCQSIPESTLNLTETVENEEEVSQSGLKISLNSTQTIQEDKIKSLSASEKSALNLTEIVENKETDSQLTPEESTLNLTGTVEKEESDSQSTPEESALNLTETVDKEETNLTEAGEKEKTDSLSSPEKLVLNLSETVGSEETDTQSILEESPLNITETVEKEKTDSLPTPENPDSNLKETVEKEETDSQSTPEKSALILTETVESEETDSQSTLENSNLKETVESKETDSQSTLENSNLKETVETVEIDSHSNPEESALNLSKTVESKGTDSQSAPEESPFNTTEELALNSTETVKREQTASQSIPEESVLNSTETVKKEERHSHSGPEKRTLNLIETINKENIKKLQEKNEPSKKSGTDYVIVNENELTEPPVDKINTQTSADKSKLKDMADFIAEQQNEISDLKLQLNASQQARASLELEIRQKEEIVIKTQAESLKKEHEFRLEIKELKEKIKENSKLIEKGGCKELEEQLKEAKEKATQAINELSIKKKQESHFMKIMEEYENSLAEQLAEQEKLKESQATIARHFSNLEFAFTDVHQKYESSKIILKGFKANEETLKLDLAGAMKNCSNLEERYESLKKHAKNQIDRSNKEIIQQRKIFEDKEIQMHAIIKRLEIKCKSLEALLEQKTSECQQLAALVDQLTGQKM